MAPQAGSSTSNISVCESCGTKNKIPELPRTNGRYRCAACKVELSIPGIEEPEYISVKNANSEIKSGKSELTKRRRGPIFPQLIAIGMLLWALNPSNPYGYYILLRWVCCAIFAYLAVRAYEIDKTPWVWVLGVAACIYNPIIRVHLTREIWTVINIVTIVVLIVTFVVLRSEAKTEKSVKQL